ncbi:MAG: hypothetical protein IJX37_00495 [Oscillospiraceae bacterium]|nr:hypothetical protein [Oscillospiraceae bacterium]
MERIELVERAKMYLQLLSNGVHPVTGQSIPHDSVFVDSKVKRCFSFITEILDEYVELKAKVEQLEKDRERNTIVVAKKQDFAITQEQRNSIKLSKEPISVMAFMKNINEVIDTETTEKLSSTRINKWLTARGFIRSEKVQTVTSKTVYKPSEVAVKIGITEEAFVDKKSGEVKTQIKLGESAQFFIIENLEEIIATT